MRQRVDKTEKMKGNIATKMQIDERPLVKTINQMNEKRSLIPRYRG